jgi:hypothetical protein
MFGLRRMVARQVTYSNNRFERGSMNMKKKLHIISRIFFPLYFVTLAVLVWTNVTQPDWALQGLLALIAAVEMVVGDSLADKLTR